jgi:iron(III) transport system substrate-binding protein
MTRRPASRQTPRIPTARRLGSVAAVSLTVGLALSACGSSTKTGASASTPGVTAATASAKKVPLVLYAAEGYDSSEGSAFQKATGIPVQVDDNSTGPLTTQIEAEKNNPKWDLFWVDGATVFASLDTQGLLYKGFQPTAYANYNAVGKSLIPADHSYVPTGVTMAAALVYNTKTVPSPPTAWSDLTSSQYKGAVGMNDPAVSGPTYPYIAGQMQHLGGVSQGEAYFSALESNGLHVYQTNTNTLQALETGVIKLATIQSSAGVGAGFKSPDIKVAYLNPETVLPSVLGISAGAKGAALSEAEEFVNFVLSPAGQKVMQSGDPTGDSLFWPLINGESPLAPLPPLSSVPTQTIDPTVWGPQQASIDTWFTQHVVQ